MKLGHILDENFQKEFIAFYSLPLPAKVSYSLKKIKEKIISEGKEYNEIKNETALKYCELDESGKPKTEQEGDKLVLVFKSEEDQAKFMKEIEELLNEEVEHFKIPLSALLESTTHIEPKFFEALDPIIDSEK